MREVLIVSGHDYTKYVAHKGLGWSRDDLDGPDSGRTMDGTMHRAKVTVKRNISFKLCNAPEAVLAQLDTDLSAEEFTMTYRDLHGKQTRTFYCSSFKANLDVVQEDDTGEWGDASFNVHEV